MIAEVRPIGMQFRRVDNIWVLRLATTVTMLWITVLLGGYFASVPVTAFTVKVLYIVGVALAGAAYCWSVWCRRGMVEYSAPFSVSVRFIHHQIDWALLTVGLCAYGARPDAFSIALSAIGCGMYWIGTARLWFACPFPGGLVPALLASCVAAFVLFSAELTLVTWSLTVFVSLIVIYLLRYKVLNYISQILLSGILFEMFMQKGWLAGVLAVTIGIAGVSRGRTIAERLWGLICDETLLRISTVLAGLCTLMLLVNSVPTWDQTHYGYYLFPARDVMFGKSPLVDINHQYGVGTIYLIAFLRACSRISHRLLEPRCLGKHPQCGDGGSSIYRCLTRSAWACVRSNDAPAPCLGEIRPTGFPRPFSVGWVLALRVGDVVGSCVFLAR